MFHVVKLSTHTGQNMHITGSTTPNEAAAEAQATALNTATGTSLHTAFPYRGKKI